MLLSHGSSFSFSSVFHGASHHFVLIDVGACQCVFACVCSGGWITGKKKWERSITKKKHSMSHISPCLEVLNQLCLLIQPAIKSITTPSKHTNKPRLCQPGTGIMGTRNQRCDCFKAWLHSYEELLSRRRVWNTEPRVFTPLPWNVFVWCLRSLCTCVFDFCTNKTFLKQKKQVCDSLIAYFSTFSTLIISSFRPITKKTGVFHVD